MPDIKLKAIETEYNGYKFRSRIEARWAVFFDALGVEYEYEAEGYDLGELGWYLPDFWLPKLKVFVEVKPSSFDAQGSEEIKKYRKLVEGIGFSLIILNGQPGYKAFNEVYPGCPENQFKSLFFIDYGPQIKRVDEYWVQSLSYDQDNGNLFFDFDDRQARESFGMGLVGAIMAAKKSRFEHGVSKTKQKCLIPKWAR